MSDFVKVVDDAPLWGECGDSAERRLHAGPHTWGIGDGPLRMCAGWPVPGAALPTPTRVAVAGATLSTMERGGLTAQLRQDIEHTLLAPSEEGQMEDLVRVALDRLEPLLVAARDLAGAVGRMRAGEPLFSSGPAVEACHDALMARLRDAGIVR